MDAFLEGLLVGLLIGEGHFGGDGKQPHVTLRMHARHEPVLRALTTIVPGSRLYGPYHHGGREYFQWMVRGAALKEELLPLLERLPWAELDPHTYARYEKMKRDYRLAAPPGATSARRPAEP